MKCSFSRLVACLALSLIVLTSAAHAGDHGKSKRAGFSPSGGNNGSAFKIQANMSRQIAANQSLGSNGGSNRGQSLTRKFGSSPLGISKHNLSSSGNQGNSLRKFSETMQRVHGSKFGDSFNSPQSLPLSETWTTKKPIGGNNGNGTGSGGNPFPGNWPTKGPHGSGSGVPGQGGKPAPHHCHFPWWTIACPPYSGGYSTTCYRNPWYYNHCYTQVVTYPATNHVTIVNETPLAQFAPTAGEIAGIDLELVDLRLVDIGDPAKNLGPRYRATFRNRGTQPAGNFQVVMMASSDGTPQSGSPSSTAEVPALAAGQVIVIDMRLTPSSTLATMPALIVAVDSASQVAEVDEVNNVAVLDRSKIAMADLAAVW